MKPVLEVHKLIIDFLDIHLCPQELGVTTDGLHHSVIQAVELLKQVQFFPRRREGGNACFNIRRSSFFFFFGGLQLLSLCTFYFEGNHNQRQASRGAVRRSCRW